jgi:hypothetical protein
VELGGHQMNSGPPALSVSRSGIRALCNLLPDVATRSSQARVAIELGYRPAQVPQSARRPPLSRPICLATSIVSRHTTHTAASVFLLAGCELAIESDTRPYLAVIALDRASTHRTVRGNSHRSVRTRLSCISLLLDGAPTGACTLHFRMHLLAASVARPRISRPPTNLS